jgi:uncharacterized protein (DUF885 family)
VRAFCSYMTTEGWAHYTEEMMADAGLGSREGMVRMALLRDARALAVVAIHTRMAKLAEVEAIFRERAGADAITAKQNAMRGALDPMMMGYTLGKLIIRKLRDDWLAGPGKGKRLKDFHDAFLSYGCAPLSTIRREMMAGAGVGLIL